MTQRSQSQTQPPPSRPQEVQELEENQHPVDICPTWTFLKILGDRAEETHPWAQL